MLKIVKRTVPLETEGTINRLSLELAEARGEMPSEPFVAEKTYQAGEYLVKNGKVYIVNDTIIMGETVFPGLNARESSLEEVINLLQQREE